MSAPPHLPTAWQAHSDAEKRRCLFIRHRIFCLGEGGEVLERHRAAAVDDYHDEFDFPAQLFGATVDGEDMGFIRLNEADLPIAALLPLLPFKVPLEQYTRYVEPSRIGVLASYPREIRRAAFLKLIAAVLNASSASGHYRYIFTVRERFLRAVPWFPWNLYGPFEYPESLGGPVLQIPMWVATLNIHELVQAARIFQPRECDLMFPGGLPGWFKPVESRPGSELADTANQNQAKIERFLATWKPGDPLP